MESAELRRVYFEWIKPCLQLSGFVIPDWERELKDFKGSWMGKAFPEAYRVCVSKCTLSL